MTLNASDIELRKEKFRLRNIEMLSEFTRTQDKHEFRCLIDNSIWQATFNSVSDDHGCPECSGKKKKTIAEVRELFNSRGYTLVSKEYKNSGTALLYICDQGHRTKCSFNSLMSGQGCLECSFDSKRKTIEEVREFFTARGYTLVSKEYKNSGTALLYICNKGHQTKISFSSLQNGNGCSSCANYGFDPNKSATLYYIRFQYEGNFYYKIGITNRDISKRFQLEKTSYTVIKETFYPVGKDALSEEQAILKEFSASRYKGKPFLTTNGNTELFTRDVLQLDYETIQNFAA